MESITLAWCAKLFLRVIDGGLYTPDPAPNMCLCEFCRTGMERYERAMAALANCGKRALAQTGHNNCHLDAFRRIIFFLWFLDPLNPRSILNPRHPNFAGVISVEELFKNPDVLVASQRNGSAWGDVFFVTATNSFAPFVEYMKRHVETLKDAVSRAGDRETLRKFRGQVLTGLVVEMPAMPFGAQRNLEAFLSEQGIALPLVAPLSDAEVKRILDAFNSARKKDGQKKDKSIDRVLWMTGQAYFERFLAIALSSLRTFAWLMTHHLKGGEPIDVLASTPSSFKEVFDLLEQLAPFAERKAEAARLEEIARQEAARSTAVKSRDVANLERLVAEKKRLESEKERLEAEQQRISLALKDLYLLISEEQQKVGVV